MAKLIDHNSIPSTKSELDLFSVPPTQVAIESGYWHAARLVNTCTSNGPWRFHVEADPHYIQLNKNLLWVKMKIVKADNTDIPQASSAVDGGAAAFVPPKIAPINLIGSTMFKQLKISLNGKLVSDSSDTYGYRCFLETVLNYGGEAKKGHLNVSLYNKDTDPVDSENNPGFAKRCERFVSSKEVEIMTPLRCDLFMANRMLLSNTELLVELHKNNDPFSLLYYGDGGEMFKLKILDMIWYIRKVEIMKSMHMAIEQTLQRTPAKYPIRRVRITKLHVAPGRYQSPNNTLFTGQLPRRLVIGCVEQAAFFGELKKSPFVFKNFDIQQITVNAGGRIYPREPLEADFGNDRYARAYLQMLEGLGMNGENTGNDISYEDFKKHLCLFVFDLTPDEQDSSHWQLLKEGSTSVDIKFRNPVPGNGIEILVYAEFENMLYIDRLRNLHADYTV